MSQPFDAAAIATAEAVRGVGAAVARSEFAQAAFAAEEALQRGLVHPALYNARALWLEREGRDADALAQFEQARALSPRDPRILNAMGLCLMRLQRFDDAIKTFDDAISLEPAYAPTHHRKGLALGFAGRIESSEQAHKRASLLDPRYAEAFASLATISARKGRFRTAREQAERALKLNPAEPTAQAALAMVENSEGAYEEARARLQDLLASNRLLGHGRAVVLGLLGDALDGLGDADAAFAAYSQANAAQHAIHAPRFTDSTTRAIEALHEQFSATDTALWQRRDCADTGQDSPRGHAFLLGFHRTGTTLLEQALESHPDVATLDERDFLGEPARSFLTSPSGLEALAALSPAAREELRSAYWQQVRKEGIDVQGRIFVDKHPFNTIKLPLIAALFPDAKILFAIRDPRDVVWSCFRRQFEIDAVKFEYLGLESTADLYERVMAFALLCREKLPLAVFDHRYEDLISDFDAQTRRVCEFLGLSWHAGMRDFAVAAQGLAPQVQSASQLRRGLYSDGAGQWRRYADYLAPVLPRLQPWVERFGYAED